MNRIAFTLEDLQQEIAKTCAKAKVFEENVRLIAVSKRQPVEKIIKLALQGQQDFAENQLQEALLKIPKLSQFPIKWHFIGSLQSRKCKPIAEHFDWVQSIDRAKLVPKLNDSRPTSKGPLNACIQVNLFNETQKSGVNREEAIQLAELVNASPMLNLRGIMALPPKTNNTQIQTKNFKEINDFYEHLKHFYSTIDTLSMGMSGDFKTAIISGSTMIRVGTSLFGTRAGTQ